MGGIGEVLRSWLWWGLNLHLSRTTESWVCVGISGGAGVGLGPVFDHKDTLAPTPVAPQLLTTLACKDMCQTATSLPWIHLQGRDGQSGTVNILLLLRPC